MRLTEMRPTGMRLVSEMRLTGMTPLSMGCPILGDTSNTSTFRCYCLSMAGNNKYGQGGGGSLGYKGHRGVSV